ncbi:MAG: hypothetical protein KJN75_04325, partial [Muriicola sp.]|nr:hypothetical protein [Muriicola sp.]
MKIQQFGVLLAFLVFLQFVTAQQKETISTIDSILHSEQFDEKSNQKFKEGLTKLQDYIRNEENKFSGEVSFGFNSQESKRDNFFVIGTGVDLSKDTYPFKFDLSSGILAQIINGELDETVSNLSISFDYNISEESLLTQSYVFLNGSNNSYVGVDQRYELGGGFLLNFYSGSRANGLTDKGKDEMKKMNGSISNSKMSEKENHQIFSEGIDLIGNSMSEANREKLEAVKKSRKRFANKIIKNYSTYRLSFLAGINIELEQTADSLELFNGDLLRKGTFEPTNRYRLVVRPGFEWKRNNFTFSTKAYFKMGIFNEFYSEVGDGQNIDKKLDYWADWNNKLSFKFTDNISLSISYSLFYDNAPN